MESGLSSSNSESQIEGLAEYVNGTPPLINMILSDDVSENLLKSLEIEEVARCLDLLSLFEEVNISNEEILLYRGLGESHPIEQAFCAKTLLSTSPDKNYASNYCSNTLPQLLKLTISRGTKILEPALYGVENPYDCGEEMILLPGIITPIEKHIEIIQNVQVTVINCLYENVQDALTHTSAKVQDFIQKMYHKE